MGDSEAERDAGHAHGMRPLRALPVRAAGLVGVAFDLNDTVTRAGVVDHLERIPVPPRHVTGADRGRGFAELADHLLGER